MQRLAQILAIVITFAYTIFALLSGGELAHNYPNALPGLLLWLVLPIAWRLPQKGGLLFVGLGVAATLFFHSYEDFVTFLIVSLPLFIVGLLLVFARPARKRWPFQHTYF